MTVKEYLSQAYRIDQRINSKLEQVASCLLYTSLRSSWKWVDPAQGKH